MKNALVPSEGGPLVDFVHQVDRDDLTKLRDWIATAETKLAAAKALEKIAAIAVGEVDVNAKKKYTKKAKVEVQTKNVVVDPPTEDRPDVLKKRSLDETRKKILRYLDEKPRTGHDIIVNCGVAPAKLQETMNYDWFIKDGGLYSLTQTGLREANDTR